MRSSCWSAPCARRWCPPGGQSAAVRRRVLAARSPRSFFTSIPSRSSSACSGSGGRPPDVERAQGTRRMVAAVPCRGRADQPRVRRGVSGYGTARGDLRRRFVRGHGAVRGVWPDLRPDAADLDFRRLHACRRATSRWPSSVGAWSLPWREPAVDWSSLAAIATATRGRLLRRRARGLRRALGRAQDTPPPPPLPGHRGWGGAPTQELHELSAGGRRTAPHGPPFGAHRRCRLGEAEPPGAWTRARCALWRCGRQRLGQRPLHSGARDANLLVLHEI